LKTNKHQCEICSSPTTHTSIYASFNRANQIWLSFTLPDY